MRCINVAGSVGGGAGWISHFRVNYICRDVGPDCWTLGEEVYYEYLWSNAAASMSSSVSKSLQKDKFVTQ